MYVYADHAATTEMSEVAKNSMIQALKDQWGNPSSLHSGGQHAKEALEAARAQIAGLLGVPEETVRTRLARAREKLKHILSEVPQT